MEYTNTKDILSHYYYNSDAHNPVPAVIVVVGSDYFSDEIPDGLGEHDEIVEQLICDTFFKDWTPKPLIIL